MASGRDLARLAPAGERQVEFDPVVHGPAAEPTARAAFKVLLRLSSASLA
jgi:hypothetical protein